MNPAEEQQREPLNPRYVLWARASGHDPYELVERHRQTGETPCLVDVEDPKQRKLPWTILFVYWNTQRRHEWGESLGYGGLEPARTAEIDGHTGYDEWLERWVENAMRVMEANDEG